MNDTTNLYIYVYVYIWTESECKYYCLLGLDIYALQRRHNERYDVWNHQHHQCLLNRLFKHASRKHQSSASLDFVRGIHRWPLYSPHIGPVTRKMFPFDDVIIWSLYWPDLMIHTARKVSGSMSYEQRPVAFMGSRATSYIILWVIRSRDPIQCEAVVLPVWGPIVGVGWSKDRLISAMGFAVLMGRHLYVASGPWSCYTCFKKWIVWCALLPVSSFVLDVAE